MTADKFFLTVGGKRIKGFDATISIDPLKGQPPFNLSRSFKVKGTVKLSPEFRRYLEELMHPSNKVTLENVKSVVRYHRPTGDQARRHEALSAATEHFLVAILENCPDCADRSAAIRHARDAKMTASAAIALEEDHNYSAPPPGADQKILTNDDVAILAATAAPTITAGTEPPSAPQPAPPARAAAAQRHPARPGLHRASRWKLARNRPGAPHQQRVVRLRASYCRRHRLLHVPAAHGG